MKNGKVFSDFILKEWLLSASVLGVVILSVYLKKIPSLNKDEWETLFILFSLFVAIKGLERSGFFRAFSRRVERGRFVPLKIVLFTFFLSMFLTNDVSLLIVVPTTLLLNLKRKDWLVILEALAANAGSALTPIGNPQNLYIYWFYKIFPLDFVATIAPFSLAFLVILAASGVALGSKKIGEIAPAAEEGNLRHALAYGILLGVIIFSVLRLINIWLGALVFVYALTFDRKSLKIDYSLLLTFLFFFALGENVRELLSAELSDSNHVFLLSALLSQLISNVPTALLFAKFTAQWKALLWGVNVGGFGSLFGSLANLIAYRFFITTVTPKEGLAFTVKFLLAGYLCFFIGIALYFLIEL